MKKHGTSLIATFVFVASALSQGTFRNLGFEEAQLIFISTNSNFVATTNALPGWGAFSGANQLSIIPYNHTALLPPVGLYGTPLPAIAGSFDLSLSDGGSVSQTGLIPADTHSLRLKGGVGILSAIVSLDGQTLSFLTLSSGTNYTLYGTDISVFAGQTAALTLFAPANVDFVIDDILLSPEPIPEPRMLGLFVLGALLVRWRWRT